MKPFLRKFLYKLPVYALYIVGIFWLGFVTLNLLANTNALIFCLGIVTGVIVIITTFILGIREILYWVKEDDGDGWEDDLTNQG